MTQWSWLHAWEAGYDAAQAPDAFCEPLEAPVLPASSWAHAYRHEDEDDRPEWRAGGWRKLR